MIPKVTSTNEVLNATLLMSIRVLIQDREALMKDAGDIILSNRNYATILYQQAAQLEKIIEKNIESLEPYQREIIAKYRSSINGNKE